jgi:hypothetical protein
LRPFSIQPKFLREVLAHALRILLSKQAMVQIYHLHERMRTMKSYLTRKSLIIGAVLLLTGVAFAFANSPRWGGGYGDHMSGYGYGYGMGPGMMGNGYGNGGYAMGRGMMGNGYGNGGYAMGPGMTGYGPGYQNNGRGYGANPSGRQDGSKEDFNGGGYGGYGPGYGCR